ncbi:MAG: alginate lyase family protein [Desulfatibacillaceae bacterium]
MNKIKDLAASCKAVLAAPGKQRRSRAETRLLPPGTWDGRLLSSYLSDPEMARPERFLRERRLNAPPFFFSPDRRVFHAGILAEWTGGQTRDDSMVAADQVLEGRFVHFGAHTWETGFPPNWHANPLTGEIVPSDQHFRDVAHPPEGDIKAVWETNRFGFAYGLARAYWRTGDERYPEGFWELFESWRESNPPMYGVNWQSSREVALRTLALCFCFHAFLESTSTTPRRAYELAQTLAVSMERVAAHLGRATFEMGGAPVAEATALYTVGLLFPEFSEARRWRVDGAGALESLMARVVLNDGSTVLHSNNEQRLLVQCGVWAARLADVHGTPLPEGIRQRLGKAADFLYQVQDGESGRVPAYGQNDGSLAYRLCTCDFTDYRPTLAAAHYLLRGTRLYHDGPWDEILLWFFGPEAPNAETEAPERIEMAATDGGYYTLRGEKSHVFTRCAIHRCRPGHADMLHVDLWWRGLPLAVDAGTYSMFSRKPWNNPLAGSLFHNTVTVDKKDQMDLAAPLKWVPWLTGRVHGRCRSPRGVFSYFEGEHDGYRRLAAPVLHRRAILRIGEEQWIIVDRVASSGEHLYRLHWLFGDYGYNLDTKSGSLVLDTPKGEFNVGIATSATSRKMTVIRADPYTPRGWRATCYLRRDEAVSVETTVREKWATFFTYMGPEPANLIASDEALTMETPLFSGFLYLRGDFDQGKPMVRTVRVEGDWEDELDMADCRV